MGQLCALVAKKASSILECIKKCGQKVKAGSPPPLLCPDETTSRVLCAVPDSAVQERWACTRECPAECCRSD